MKNSSLEEDLNLDVQIKTGSGSDPSEKPDSNQSFFLATGSGTTTLVHIYEGGVCNLAPRNRRKRIAISLRTRNFKVILILLFGYVRV